MFGSRTAWRRIACVIGGLCLGGALALPIELRAEEVAPPVLFRPIDDNGKNKGKEEGEKGKKEDKKEAEAKRGLGQGLPSQFAGVPVLDLASCKAIALTKQPALAAGQAAHQAALARQHGLDTIKVPRFLARDLPIRKQQAAVGVQVTQLDVDRVQLDVVYSVTFCYLTAQYATEQRYLLESVRERLVKLQQGVEAGIEAGKTNIRKEDVARVRSSLNVLDAHIQEAISGEQRAMSGLREAMGVDPYSPLIIRATGLYRLRPDLDRDQMIAHALARRPEIQQVTLMSQVHGLEVEAQSLKRLFPTAPTFASGSDLHARLLPAGSYDEHYRPAAVGLDMPVTINGNCAARAEVASAYEQRSGSVVEKTKNLLVLETEQAYARYLEACKKLPLLEEAADNAQEVFAATNRAYQVAGKSTITPRDWILAGTQVTELRSQVNLARYQLLIALAGLERATACGYQPAFELAPTTDPLKKERQEEKKDNGKKNDNDVDAGKLDAPKKENN